MVILTEASETDEVPRNHAKALGFKRVIKDCCDKRRFRMVSGKRRKPHVYCRGFSCQPFSLAGKNGGLSDQRSSSMKGTVRYILKERPLVFILENVKKSCDKAQANQEKLVKKILQSKTYTVHERVVNALESDGIQWRELWFWWDTTLNLLLMRALPSNDPLLGGQRWFPKRFAQSLMMSRWRTTTTPSRGIGN